jgi:polyisoprenoid-binding protein YceI
MKIQLWQQDKAHSGLYFSAQHLMLSNTRGWFSDFDVIVKTKGSDFDNAEVVVSVRVKSVNSGNSKRDMQLLAEDFFYAERYPEMLFVSSSVKHTGGSHFLIEGLLTIKGIKKQVTFYSVYLGKQTDPFNGVIKAGFSFQSVINRKHFNLHWDRLSAEGIAVVSDEIVISAEIELMPALGESTVSGL